MGEMHNLLSVEYINIAGIINLALIGLACFSGGTGWRMIPGRQLERHSLALMEIYNMGCSQPKKMVPMGQVTACQLCDFIL